jgi:hypothetical protein
VKTEFGPDGPLEVTLLHRENGCAQRLRQLRLCQHAEVAALRCRTAILGELPGKCLERIACTNTHQKVFCLRTRGVLVVVELDQNMPCLTLFVLQVTVLLVLVVLRQPFLVNLDALCNIFAADTDVLNVSRFRQLEHCRVTVVESLDLLVRDLDFAANHVLGEGREAYQALLGGEVEIAPVLRRRHNGRSHDRQTQLGLAHELALRFLELARFTATNRQVVHVRSTIEFAVYLELPLLLDQVGQLFVTYAVAVLDEIIANQLVADQAIE